MRTTSLVVLTLVAACGKGSSSSTNNAASGSAPAPTPTGSAPAAPAPAAAPPTASACPTSDALTAKLAELFKVKADAISNAGCVAGKFPVPGWYVSAYVSLEDSTVDRSAIVDAKGTIASQSDEEVSPGMLDSSGSGDFRAVDFDKDGTDEVVYVWSSDRRGYAESGVVVIRLANKGAWETALTRTFSYDSSAAVEDESQAESCEATWEIDANLAIVFTPKGKTKSKNEESCVLAKETWTLGADKKFAKAAAKKG